MMQTFSGWRKASYISAVTSCSINHSLHLRRTAVHGSEARVFTNHAILGLRPTRVIHTTRLWSQDIHLAQTHIPIIWTRRAIQRSKTESLREEGMNTGRLWRFGIKLGDFGRDRNARAPHNGEGPGGVKPTSPQARAVTMNSTIC